MEALRLPFPGYSWPFTQHAIAIKPETLYGLLACASLFAGKRNPGRGITSMMIRNGLLTPNLRGGKPDAWRDYQQVLAELGLIYSTKVEKKLKLTPAGKMFLSGEMGFSELMTAQAMRYQYPNGQKFDLQARLRRSVGKGAKNLMDLYASSGVLIKPATLIARVLIGLEERGMEATLSIDESLEFLLPLKNNSEWNIGLEGIIASRKRRAITQSPNRHARRNVQDWFKFLGLTDFFSVLRNSISLSSYGQHAILQLKSFCDDQSRSESFWIPESSDKNARMDWFNYFGEIPLGLQVIRPKEQIDSNYEKENYIGGMEEDSDEDMAEIGSPAISLAKVANHKQKAISETPAGFDADTALSNLRQGIIRRRTKALMHDEIVIELAKHLESKGAKVYEDPDSVDLLAVWPDKMETLFEVKTVSRRNVPQRIRLGIGQLEEYAYRQNISQGSRPEKVLVINADLIEGHWYLKFLNERMGISLISKTKDGYKTNLAKDCKTGKYWGL